MRRTYNFETIDADTPEEAREEWASLHPKGWTHFDAVDKVLLTRADASTFIERLTWNRPPGLIVAVQYKVPRYSKRIAAAERKLENLIRSMSTAPEGWRKLRAHNIALQRQKLLEWTRQLSQQSDQVCWLVGGILNEGDTNGTDYNSRARQEDKSRGRRESAERLLRSHA